MKVPALLLLFAAMLPALALADGPHMYKWTDVDGVVHYSDKPPVRPASDLKTMDVPSFPAPDPAKIAAHLAKLVAAADAAQKLLQAQLDQQAQERELREQAQLQAEAQARQAAQEQSRSEAPVYVSSGFVPHAYRANLYVPHSWASGVSSPIQSEPSRPALPVLQKPR